MAVEINILDGLYWLKNLKPLNSLYRLEGPEFNIGSKVLLYIGSKALKLILSLILAKRL